jgi:hypothetical protein
MRLGFPELYVQFVGYPNSRLQPIDARTKRAAYKRDEHDRWVHRYLEQMGARKIRLDCMRKLRALGVFFLDVLQTLFMGYDSRLFSHRFG